jgi:hypothetical protein
MSLAFRKGNFVIRPGLNQRAAQNCREIPKPAQRHNNFVLFDFAQRRTPKELLWCCPGLFIQEENSAWC